MERSQTNGILLIIAGAILGILAAEADSIGLGAPGWSFQQGLVTSLGAGFILLGTYLTRFDGRILILAGLVITAFALLTDKLGLGGPGFGCPQGIVTAMGAGIFFIGVYFLKVKT